MIRIRKNVKRLVYIFSTWATVLILSLTEAEGAVVTLAGGGPTGLTGSTQVKQGSEVLIYFVGLQENALFGRQANLGSSAGGVPLGIEISITDITAPTGILTTAPTGLVPADFTELRLYKSTDNVFDGSDTPMLTGVAANVGAPTVFDVTGLATGVGNIREIPNTAAGGTYFLITAVISPTATPGHAFRVGAADPHIGVRDTAALLDYPFSASVVAADINNIIIVSSSAGSSLNGQAGGGRGIPFGGEPVMLVLLVGTGLYMIRRRLV